MLSEKRPGLVSIAGAAIVAALQGTPLGNAFMASGIGECIECQEMARQLGDKPDCQKCLGKEPSLNDLYLVAWALARAGLRKIEEAGSCETVEEFSEPVAD